jgi:hypothetical protein
MARPFVLTSDLLPRRAPRQLAGANAQRAGSNFQKAIDWAAGIHKNYVAIHGLPNFGGKRIGGGKVVTTKICCDNVGGIVGGPGLFFDAKSTSAVSLDLRVMIFSKLHQLNFLRKMSRANQVAGYLIEAKEHHWYYWLDVCWISETDTTLRFKRDGVLCKQFVELGPTSGAVDFKKLADIYTNRDLP